MSGDAMDDGLGLVSGETPRDPEELEASADASCRRDLPLRMGPVHLTVAEFERSVRYYTEAVGLRLLDGH